MDRPRIRFLPLFFTLLIVAFAVAVAMRIHRYAGSVSAGADGAAERGASTTDTRAISSPVAESGAAAATAPAGKGASTTMAESERQREREQRYNRLLHEPLPSAGQAGRNAGSSAAKPQPAATPKAPQKQPSLLSRVVAPIVNAFSSAPAARTPAQTSSAAAQDPRDPKNPDSDITPPQLLGAEFIPPSVKDGESTILAITATDDLSGIASIAGNVISPSGALQGFAVQREGDTNRYTTRIAIPKNAAEGIWHVNYLSLTDKANNTAMFSYGQGTLSGASFRVISSDADSTPPTLRAIWLDHPSMKAGEKNTVFVQADDDKSGVNLISGVFLSPAKFARVGFGCRLGEGADAWACDFVPPANSDCGDWQLEQVQLQDKANNMVAVRRDNPLVAAVHLTVLADQCDSHPPSVDMITLDRPVTAAPGTIVVRVTASDDISGVSSVNGHFVFTGKIAGMQPPRLWFACSATDPQTWSGSVAVPANEAVGVWRLEQVQILDRANNLKIYTIADPVVANVSFRVQ